MYKSEGEGNDSWRCTNSKNIKERVVAHEKNVPRTGKCDYLNFVLHDPKEKTIKQAIISRTFKITGRIRKIKLIFVECFTVYKALLHTFSHLILKIVL